MPTLDPATAGPHGGRAVKTFRWVGEGEKAWVLSEFADGSRTVACVVMLCALASFGGAGWEDEWPCDGGAWGLLIFIRFRPTKASAARWSFATRLVDESSGGL